MSTPTPRPPKAKKPQGETVEERTARFDAAAQEREQLSQAQAAFGHQRRLEKLARKDPMLRRVIVDLRAKEAQLAAQASRIADLEREVAAAKKESAPPPAGGASTPPAA